MNRILNFSSNTYSLLSDDVSMAMENALKISKNHRQPSFGRDNRIKTEIETARYQIARLLNALPQMLFFEGFSSKSNAGVTFTAMNFLDVDVIVTMASENEEKINFLKSLEASGTIKLIVLDTIESGKLDLTQFRKILSETEQKKLITLSHGNRINGKLLPVKEIGSICKENGCYFHLDTSITVGKYTIDFKTLSPDFMSFNTGLMHGPEGISCLIINPEISINDQTHDLIFNYFRSIENQNLSLIKGIDLALGLAIDDSDYYRNKVSELKNHLISKLLEKADLVIDSEGLINVITIYTQKAKFGGFLSEKFDLKGFSIECYYHSGIYNKMPFDLIISIALNEEITLNEIDSFIEYLEILQKEK